MYQNGNPWSSSRQSIPWPLLTCQPLTSKNPPPGGPWKLRARFVSPIPLWQSSLCPICRVMSRGGQGFGEASCGLADGQAVVAVPPSVCSLPRLRQVPGLPPLLADRASARLTNRTKAARHPNPSCEPGPAGAFDRFQGRHRSCRPRGVAPSRQDPQYQPLRWSPPPAARTAPLERGRNALAAPRRIRKARQGGRGRTWAYMPRGRGRVLVASWSVRASRHLP